MKCYSPLKAKREPVTDHKGKIINYKIIFTNDERQGISELEIPCGQCIGCRLNHAESWAIRMIHETRYHNQNSFVTLTYNDESLPENNSLKYEDMTLFIKKLRKVLDKAGLPKIQYYYAGEYGEELSRPHYHMVLFGFNFSNKIRYKNKENKLELQFTTEAGHDFYTSTLLTDLWSHGHCNLSTVSYDTCMYTAKYVTKKVTGPLKQNHYGKLIPEQARMSRKNPIGKKWLEQFWTDLYPDDFCIHKNKKLKIPQYYDKWLEKHNPELYEEIKMKRESFTQPIDTIELNRQYEVNLLKHEQHTTTTGEKTKLNYKDIATMQYKRRDINEYHKQRKHDDKQNSKLST